MLMDVTSKGVVVTVTPLSEYNDEFYICPLYTVDLHFIVLLVTRKE